MSHFRSVLQFTKDYKIKSIEEKMKRIKTGLKKVYLIYKKWVFLFSDNYKRIKQDKHKRKLILIDTPAHGNLGDQAIALAEQKFIREMLGLDFYELTKEDYLVGKKALSKVIRREDMLLIHGGGFLGTLWQNEEDIFLSILKEFSSNKIVVFPQTVFFEDSDHGRLERERMEKSIKECAALKIFLRDKNSYRIMTENLHLTNRQCFLVPDIVTYLKAESGNQKRTKILFCIRRDKEKTSDEKQLLTIFHSLEEAGEDVTFTDMVVDRRIGKKERQKAVSSQFIKFSSAKLVITDRIHGMLFAAVTGTPCIALDNVSKKVSGAYEWIQYLDYIQFKDEKEITLDHIWDMLGKKNCVYSNLELQEYYDLMKKEIASQWESELN